MTTRKVAGAAFLVLIMLVCLPAFHSATGLHAFGEAVDAFDQGVRVPETTSDTAVLAGTIVLLLAFSKMRLDARAAAHADNAPCGPPAPARRSSAHAPRHAGASGADSHSADAESSSGLLGMLLTSRPLADSRGPGGSSVIASDRTNRKGVSNAFQA